MAEESRIDDLSQSESGADEPVNPATQLEKLPPPPGAVALQIFLITKLLQSFFTPMMILAESIAGKPSASKTKKDRVTWNGETGTSTAATPQAEASPAEEPPAKKPRPNKKPAAAVSQVQVETEQEGKVEDPEPKKKADVLP